MPHTLNTPNQRLARDLDLQISAVSVNLQGSMLPIVEVLIGSSSHRPIALARRLKIDKTLTGRILRSVKANDPFEVIHNAPAPHGLRIFLQAAEKAGVNPELRARAEQSITDFESLIHTFPEGRAALEAAISDHIPEIRRQNERAAKQAVYKSMSYLLGYQAEASLLTSVASPSPCGNLVDMMHVDSMIGLRRLRGETPVNLFGIRRHDTRSGTPNWMETLDGVRGVEDARLYLLEDYCDNPIPRLSVRENGNVLYSVLDAESLPINRPMTIVNSWKLRNASLRYSNAQHTHEWHSSLLRIPMRVRIQDYFIHKDIWPSNPEFVPSMPGLSQDSVRSGDHKQRHDTIDMDIPLQQLGVGINRPELRHSSVPRYQELLRRIFDTANLNPDDYRVYRSEVVYPVPFVRVTAWFELPEAPAES